MPEQYVFTSESVTRGHPDKLCDQISDAIVDQVLREDEHASVVAECAVANGVLFVSTHFACPTAPPVADIARAVIRDIGYGRDVFDADACAVMTTAVDHTARDYRRLDLDALDARALATVTARGQATLFGYACDQTPALLPLPIWLAHQLARRLDEPGVRAALPWLVPDATVQVGVEYADGRPRRLHSIAVEAHQRTADTPDLEQVRAELRTQVIEPVLAAEPLGLDDDTRLVLNPAGPVVGGGPAAHAGLTGRKTGSDTYGHFGRHGSSALSGKDPLRIDRVGAYAARWAAKHVVAAGLARECEVQLSYALGLAGPVSVRVQTFGTGTLPQTEIARRLLLGFDFRLGAIVRDLDLHQLPARHPEGFYRRLAAYGQMGRLDLDPPWERLDRLAVLTGG